MIQTRKQIYQDSNNNSDYQDFDFLIDRLQNSNFSQLGGLQKSLTLLISPTAKYESGKLKYIIKTDNSQNSYAKNAKNSNSLNMRSEWKYESEGRIVFNYNTNFNKQKQMLLNKKLDNAQARKLAKENFSISENVDLKFDLFKLGSHMQNSKYLYAHQAYKSPQENNNQSTKKLNSPQKKRQHSAVGTILESNQCKLKDNNFWEKYFERKKEEEYLQRKEKLTTKINTDADRAKHNLRKTTFVHKVVLNLQIKQQEFSSVTLEKKLEMEDSEQNSATQSSSPKFQHREQLQEKSRKRDAKLKHLLNTFRMKVQLNKGNFFVRDTISNFIQKIHLKYMIIKRRQMW